MTFSPSVNRDYQFLPNILDLYDNATYNISFYMLSESDIISENYDSPNKLIIAESGKSGQYTIDDLEIISNPSPSNRDKNTEARTFSFTIREFYGANLLDRLYAASLDLGVKNYTQCPYFLKLSFRARDEMNSSPDTDLNDLSWIWSLSIRNIESMISGSGAEYTFEAYEYANRGEFQDIGRIEKSTRLVASTVNEAMSELEKKLNKNAREKAVTHVTLPDEYVINVDPEIGRMKMIRPQSNLDSGRSFDLPDRGGPPSFAEGIDGFQAADRYSGLERTISIENGISITTAINRILTASPDYQRMARNAVNESSLDVSDSEVSKKIHKISFNTSVLNYDIGRGDYQKRIEITISPYEMHNIVVDPSELSARGSTKYQYIKGTGALRKRYDYIFTGLNDQVLDFDMSFNLAWQVYTSSQAGNLTSYASVGEGQYLTTKYLKMQEIRMMISRMNVMAGVETSEVSSPQEISAEIQNSEELTDQEKEELELLLSFNTRRRIPDNVTASTDADSPSNRFLEDYAVGGVGSKETKFRRFPYSFYESDATEEMDDYALSVESNKGSGRELTNALFQQAFAQKSNAFVNVDIQIKGDPYWISSKFIGFSAKDVIDSMRLQPCIVFNVQQPELWDDNTGLTNFSSSGYSGLFVVREVVSSFSGGKFTQTLSCHRDNLVDIEDINEVDSSDEDE